MRALFAGNGPRVRERVTNLFSIDEPLNDADLSKHMRYYSERDRSVHLDHPVLVHIHRPLNGRVHDSKSGNSKVRRVRHIDLIALSSHRIIEPTLLQHWRTVAKLGRNAALAPMLAAARLGRADSETINGGEAVPVDRLKRCREGVLERAALDLDVTAIPVVTEGTKTLAAAIPRPPKYINSVRIHSRDGHLRLVSFVLSVIITITMTLVRAATVFLVSPAAEVKGIPSMGALVKHLVQRDKGETGEPVEMVVLRPVDLNTPAPPVSCGRVLRAHVLPEIVVRARPGAFGVEARIATDAACLNFRNWHR